MKEGVEDLKDFRLINLVDALYRLLAKVLADTIKKVIFNTPTPPSLLKNNKGADMGKDV